MKQRDDKKEDERFQELVKRMKAFNELLGDYLDAIDMEDGDGDDKDDKDDEKEGE